LVLLKVLLFDLFNHGMTGPCCDLVCVVDIGLHLAQSLLERICVFSLNLVDMTLHAFVVIEDFAVALESAALANNLRPCALVDYVRQVGVYSLVNFSVSALVDTG
jgi:hypothetical protein